MKKVIFYGMVVLALVACGGGSGGSGGSNGGGTSCTNCVDPADINLTKDIQDDKITGYNSNDPINIQYLSVINYFRSLNIVCNDAMAVEGPSGSDMEWNDDLADSAKEHSDDMMKSNWYNHNGSGTSNDITGQTFTPARPSTFSERISHNGFSNNLTAENIGIMRTKPNNPPSDAWITAMEGWIKSEHGHCSNIMHPDLKYFGMYESRTTSADSAGWNKVYWTQDFGGN